MKKNKKKKQKDRPPVGLQTIFGTALKMKYVTIFPEKVLYNVYTHIKKEV